MRIDEKVSTPIIEFDSMADLRNVVEKDCRDTFIMRHFDDGDSDFMGGVTSFPEMMVLAKNGWEDDVQEVLSVSESTLETIERTFDVQSWQSVYDVTGSDVDVDRYLSGQPENMISYVMMDTPKVGRVVTLSVNVGASWMVDTDTIQCRGKNITALVYALEALGIRTELYADLQIHGMFREGNQARNIVKIKAAEDTLDPAMVMFAFAHPGFMRSYMLASLHKFSKRVQGMVGVGEGYGIPTKGFTQDVFPEGTISVPIPLQGGKWNADKARDFVVENLRELGMID